jgi:Amidohydrolase family
VGKDLGSVEPGKLADLTFISGDPLTEIKDLANVQAVMKNGRFYAVPELMQPFVSPSALQSRAAAPQHRLLAPTPEAARGGKRHWWHDPEQMVEEDHR